MRLFAFAATFVLLTTCCGLVQADLFGIRLGAGVIESYSVSSTGVATPLATPSFAISGGWGTGMFAVDVARNKYYVMTDPSGSGGANLYTRNLTTGGLISTQTLGGAAPARIDAIAVRSDGSLFGLDLGVGSFDTYSIDPGTANATLLGNFAISGGWGNRMFAGDAANNAFYVMTDPSGSGGANLYTLNFTTGALQSTQTLSGAAPARIDALGVRADGSILGLDLGISLLDTYSIAPGTANATSLGSFAITGGWSDGNLAVDNINNKFFTSTTTPNLYTNNLLTGALQSTNGITGALRFDALASTAIPEPSAFLFLCLVSCIVSVATIRRRRRRGVG